MKILAPAKINISLKVIGKRADGYHELRTMMVPVALFDELYIERASSGVSLICHGMDIKTEDNLAHRAAMLFLEKSALNQGVSIDLVKHIPAGAGLGGGSSDAVAVLLAMNELFDPGFCFQDILSMASILGADCPFFVYRRAMLMGERGDEAIREIDLIQRSYLLVVPGFGVSTAMVFKNLKSPLTTGNDPYSVNNIGDDLVDPLEYLLNDLEPVVFDMYPEMEEMRQDLLDTGASGVLMSGSGSCIFGVYPDESHLSNAMSRILRHKGYSYIPTSRWTGDKYGYYRGKGVSGQG
ncbi:MAG: 4-(cytidine 5'-diphospho)-2-C-methyl-D-erythritol kinase [Thermodesulfobacteriota bacterium]|nr:4-(cytidine 5'-diphospho)-2-C-methyl-D-erythritol kinase [Thermodesulfobacteriota bacterium]